MTPRLSDMARCSCAPIINPLKKTLFGDGAQMSIYEDDKPILAHICTRSHHSSTWAAESWLTISNYVTPEAIAGRIVVVYFLKYRGSFVQLSTIYHSATGMKVIATYADIAWFASC
ncbi:hypothetical protein LshimejAT787_1203600 [Lyophyllum shimeji]|uniref:Uncharacterized protein n=1 Tax=Lyophyllum shimeji TaxID=47721 RepID=A0A9P3UU78_LYOSH|nr:hypothetical protein LshimejAT787_1203600 [Lyophyllum shimeji]